MELLAFSVDAPSPLQYRPIFTSDKYERLLNDTVLEIQQITVSYMDAFLAPS